MRVLTFSGIHSASMCASLTNIELDQSACNGRGLLRAVLCLALLFEAVNSGCREMQHEKKLMTKNCITFVLVFLFDAIITSASTRLDRLNFECLMFQATQPAL